MDRRTPLLAAAGTVHRRRLDSDLTVPTGPIDPRTRAVVIGDEPTGKAVTRLLRENGIAHPTIFELNMGTVQRRATGRPPCGLTRCDCRIRPPRVRASLRQTVCSLTSAGMAEPAKVHSAWPGVEPARPRARTRGVSARFTRASEGGADCVFTGEGEVALAFVETILHRLGATPEQIHC